MKKRHLLALLAATPLLLTSCDKVTAKFLDGETKLTNVETQRGVQIDHNTLEVIYKKIKDGGTYTNDVKELLTRALVKEVLGDFRVVADGNGGYSIKVVDLEKEGVNKTEWIKKHSAYKNWKSSDYKLVLDDADVTEAQFDARINLVKSLVEKQMLTTLWNEANTASYKRNNRFYEIQFAKSVYDKLFKVTKADGATALTEDEIDALYDTPDYTTHYVYDQENAFNGFDKTGKLDLDTFTNGALIDYTYNAETASGRENIKKVLHVACYIDYINNTIIPTIMNNLLVEQYILEEQYNAIGATQTRKVNYLKIENNEAKNAENFLTKVINEQLFVGNKKGETLTNEYTIAQEAWKGIQRDLADGQQSALANEIFGAATNKNKLQGKEGHETGAYIEEYGLIPLYYYDNTEYADLLEKYASLTHDPDTNNASNTTTFTTIDNINYSPIVGLEIKTDEIRVKNFQTYGWQTKEGSSIPDTAKKKLYSYGFTNEWNEALQRNASGKTYEGSYIYQPSANGVSYLMKDSYTSKTDSILWQDGTSFYVIAIEDVVTPETLSLEGANDAKKSEIEEKARTAAYTLASGTTYTTNALTHYLQKCNISYHDQDVYDYFVSNFPKLFE